MTYLHNDILAWGVFIIKRRKNDKLSSSVQNDKKITKNDTKRTRDSFLNWCETNISTIHVLKA